MRNGFFIIEQNKDISNSAIYYKYGLYFLFEAPSLDELQKIRTPVIRL